MNHYEQLCWELHSQGKNPIDELEWQLYKTTNPERIQGLHNLLVTARMIFCDHCGQPLDQGEHNVFMDGGGTEPPETECFNSNDVIPF